MHSRKPLSWAAFHPMRFARRPYARKMIDKYLREVGPRMMTSAQANAQFAAMAAVYNDTLSRLPINERPKNVDVLIKEVSVLSHSGMFTAYGRRIYHVPEELGMALDRTSLSGIRFSDLRLPSPCFYIHLGHALTAALPGPPNEIDGIYVISQTGNLQLLITSRRTDKDVTGSRTRWVTDPEPYYYISLNVEPADRTIQAALDEAIQTGDLPLEPDQELIDQLEAGVDAARPAAAELGLSIQLPQERAAVRQASFNLQGLAAAKRAAALAINTICFLTAEPDDLGPPDNVDDAPEGLCHKLSSGTKGPRAEARRRLEHDGFFEIRHIGPRICGRLPGFTREFLGRVAHLRVGHHRRQHHGPGGSLVKLLWILPTFVTGTDPADNIPPARLHVVQ